MFETFGDISVDEAANNAASNFIKDKIRHTVKDPEKARKLLPTQFYARRPLCDAGYYEQFNRENVELIGLQETPIAEITSKGIKTCDNKEYELDVIIFATGFDAVDGNYTRVAIRGRDGQSLKDHWAPAGPISYLGVSVPNFPNMFMILGPNGPFCNIPPAIESQVEFISDIIEATEHTQSQDVELNNGQGSILDDKGRMPANRHTNKKPQHPVIEATSGAEEDWTTLCDELSANSLFRKTDSWIFGSNIPGKKHTVMFYFGGLSAYRNKLRQIAKDGWEGFKIT